MKTNKLILALAAILMCSSMALTSCKKKKAFKEENGQASEDSRNIQSENDAAVNEVNTEVGNVAALHGRGTDVNQASAIRDALGITAAGYTVDLTNASNGSIMINYNGTVINNRKREGSIKLTVLDYANGKRWKDAGCILQVDYIDYKVTRASDGKFVIINGSQHLTNETGGTWWELLFIKTQTSLSSSVKANGPLNVKFDDGKTAQYHINRKFTYTLPGNVLTCTGEGIGSSESLSNLENYGTTRDGDSFTSQVTTPVVWNWTCGWWAPTQGAVDIKVSSKDFNLKVTFAVDQSGNPVNVAANTCAYGWKVEWKHKSKTKNKIFKYL